MDQPELSEVSGEVFLEWDSLKTEDEINEIEDNIEIGQTDDTTWLDDLCVELNVDVWPFQ